MSTEKNLLAVVACQPKAGRSISVEMGASVFMMYVDADNDGKVSRTELFENSCKKAGLQTDLVRSTTKIRQESDCGIDVVSNTGPYARG